MKDKELIYSNETHSNTLIEPSICHSPSLRYLCILLIKWLRVTIHLAGSVSRWQPGFAYIEIM